MFGIRLACEENVRPAIDKNVLTAIIHGRVGMVHVIFVVLIIFPYLSENKYFFYSVYDAFLVCKWFS